MLARGYAHSEKFKGRKTKRKKKEKQLWTRVKKEVISRSCNFIKFCFHLFFFWVYKQMWEDPEELKEDEIKEIREILQVRSNPKLLKFQNKNCIKYPKSWFSFSSFSMISFDSEQYIFKSKNSWKIVWQRGQTHLVILAVLRMDRSLGNFCQIQRRRWDGNVTFHSCPPLHHGLSVYLLLLVLWYLLSPKAPLDFFH